MTRPVRPPEIGELRAFCAAVDLGSIGRAARLLQVSQPGLSKRLRALESLTGAPLLNRSPRGVTPTPAGARLHAEARKLLADMENVEALLTGLPTHDGPIRLATSHTMAEFVLPGPLVEFEGLHEHHLSIDLFIANSVVARQLVREGRAELGVAAADPTKKPDRTLEELPFLDDEVIVAVPDKHEWAKVDEIEPEDLARTPMIMRDPNASTRRVVESVLADNGLELVPPLAEVGSTSAAKATALSEQAPALLSQLAVRNSDESFVTRRVRGLRFPRHFALVFASEDTLTPDARALVDHLLKKPPRNSGPKAGS